MNIKGRLEKLESMLLSESKSDACGCPGERGCNVILPDLNKSESDRLRERDERLKPVYCKKCGKVIERQLIEIVPVEGQLVRNMTDSAER